MAKIFEDSPEAIHQVPQVAVDKDIYSPENHGDTVIRVIYFAIIFLIFFFLFWFYAPFMHAILQNEGARTESINLPLNNFLV
ncbi:hypothetical protein T11_10683 [Trichinella zimbabwensis]|uniref:Uncharacterized protein n=1 Tax=Trichinella zimbabwensis TaxID=268475 RepID=A0A0V1I914_9BILA|nr:hypothetical protein T11_10683 [Trichinella zimbabwensis]